MGRAEAHTGRSRSADRAWSAFERQAREPGPPCRAATLTAQRQCEQGSPEPTGSPLRYSRPFRKQPVGGEGASDPPQEPPPPHTHTLLHVLVPAFVGARAGPSVSSLNARPRRHSPTHHHTAGSRCLAGAVRGTGTGWCTLAGGTERGPPGRGRRGRKGQGKGPLELRHVAETAIESLRSTY